MWISLAMVCFVETQFKVSGCNYNKKDAFARCETRKPLFL